MSHSEVEEFQLYFSRIRPIYQQLFNIAHAVSGSCEQAEYCLQYAMLDRWSMGENPASHHGFREGLRNAVVRIALKSPAAEPDWNGLQTDPENDDPLLQLISQENTEMRRLLTLRYGCGLSLRRIARITGGDSKRIRTQLHRFEARTRRKLSAGDSRRCEALLLRVLRAQLNQPSGLAPEMGKIFRSFQADAEAVSRPSRLPVRILRMILGAVLTIFCILAFWLTAVLLQPPVLEDPGAQAEIHETLQ